MNGSMYLRALGMILGSIGMWVFFRFTHADGTDGGMKHYIVQVPRWLSLLCGRPLPDSKVELAAMLGQLGTFLAPLLWLLALLFNLGTWLQAALSVGVVGTSVMVCFVARATISVIKRGEKGDRTGGQ